MPSRSSRGRLVLLETQGLTPLVAGADAMLKAAQVELGGLGLHRRRAVSRADLWRCSGRADGARSRSASSRADWHRVRDSCFAPAQQGARPLLPPAPAVEPRSTGALGLIETIGYAAIVGSADAMLKAADVQIERLSIGSGGRIAALATGHLDDVQAAVHVGAEAATALGQLDASAIVF